MKDTSPLNESNGYAVPNIAPRPHVAQGAIRSTVEGSSLIADAAAVQTGRRDGRAEPQRLRVAEMVVSPIARPERNSGRQSAGDATPGGGALVKDAINVSALPNGSAESISRSARRTDRYDLHDDLRRFTTMRRLRGCGRWRIAAERGVTVNVGTCETGERVSYISGVQRCGSSWVCPVCGPKIRQARAVEVETAALAHLATGGALYTMIVTLPHDAPDDLVDTWGVLSEGFKRMMGGRAHRTERDRYGLCGYIRSSEVTHGANGWHPHAHPLLFADAELSADDLVALADGMHGRWSRYVQSRGYRAPARHLCALHPVRDGAGVAAYVVKAGINDETEHTTRLGMELARGDLKTVGKTESVWRIAERAAAGSARDVMLWKEWERISKGKRCISWSRGLRARFAVEEQTDDELAAAQAETRPTERVEVDPGEWDIISRRPGVVSTLLLIAELLGVVEARAFVVRTVADHIGERVGVLYGPQESRPPPLFGEQPYAVAESSARLTDPVWA